MRLEFCNFQNSREIWENQNWQLEITFNDNYWKLLLWVASAFDKMTPTLKVRFYCQEISLWFFIHMTVWPLHLHSWCNNNNHFRKLSKRHGDAMHSFQLLLSLLDWWTSITQTLLVSRSKLCLNQQFRPKIKSLRILTSSQFTGFSTNSNFLFRQENLVYPKTKLVQCIKNSKKG